MSFRDPSNPMWVQALRMLEKAERLQRHYFQPRKGSQSGPVWEPPVDICENADELIIWVALPGVEPGNVNIVVEDKTLAIIGERFIFPQKSTVIRRMEIPYGRFERRINLTGEHFQITENILINGCLRLVLKKI